MFKKKRLFLCLMISGIVYGVDIGSDTVVTRFNNQVLVSNGDRIAGFAGLNAGFQLFDSVTTALWDSFFSVAGDIELSAGQLNLNQDLILNENGRIASMGNIAGNYHQLQLAGVSNQDIPSGTLTECNISFLLQQTFPPQNVLTSSWSYDDQYIAVGLQANVANPELYVYEFDGTSLNFEDSLDTGGRVATVHWHPTKFVLAMGQGAGASSQLRIFTFSASVGLTQIQTVPFTAEVFGVRYDPSGNYLAVTSQATAQEVTIYPVNGDGTVNTGGAVIFNVTPNQTPDFDSLSWDATGSYLAVGFTGGASPLKVFLITFSPLAISLNATFALTRVRGVSWNYRYPDLLASAGNAAPRIRIFRHNGGAGTLTQIASTTPGSNGFTINWNPVNGECLAVGLANNAATEFRTYFWNNTALTLTQIDGFEYSTNVRNVRWSRDADYISVGTNNDNLDIYRVDAAFEDFTFSNLKLFLNGNVAMSDSNITFTGNNLIDGRNNCLTMMPTATFRVAADTSILMQNIRIEGIKDGSIQMLDATSSVSFKNCTFVMDEDFNFDNGTFDVVQGFNVEGRNHNFLYTSDQTSRILEQGIMVIDTDVTFSYYPSNNSSELLQMTHSQSTLRLQSGTIATSSAGLRLTMGKVQVDGKSFLRNDGTIQSEGIFFGDGMSLANNISLEIEPAANLQILSGFFTHDNV